MVYHGLSFFFLNSASQSRTGLDRMGGKCCADRKPRLKGWSDKPWECPAVRLDVHVTSWNRIHLDFWYIFLKAGVNMFRVYLYLRFPNKISSSHILTLLSFILSDFALGSSESCISGSKVYDMRGLKAAFSTLILDLGRCVKRRQTVQLLNNVQDRLKCRLESRSVARTETEPIYATHCYPIWSIWFRSRSVPMIFLSFSSGLSGYILYEVFLSKEVPTWRMLDDNGRSICSMVLYFFHLLSLPMHHWNHFWFAKGGPICPGWPASRFRTWDRLAWSEGGKLGLGPRVSVESVDLSSAVAKSAKCFDAGFLTVLQSLLPSHKSRLSL